MDLVREARRHAGLTQAEFAARAGTSRTRLSAYEHAHTEPGLDVLVRITGAAGLELAVQPAGTRRLRDQVALIAATLRAGDDRYALRLVAEMVDWHRRSIVDHAAFDTDPGSVGDPRWDALIGGVTEMLAHECGGAVPAWASAPARALDRWWFVTSLRSLRASVFVETPPPLAARGVFLSGSSLRSV